MAEPDPKNPSHRTKAFKLRRAARNGQQLAAVDALWLSDYEEKQQRAKKAAAAPTERGRSKSARRLRVELDEAAEAEGEGPTAAAAAVGAALAVKEEGKRLDALLLNSVESMKASAEINRETALMIREDYGAMFRILSRRAEVLEQTHIEMLQSVRQHFLHATQIEGALMQRDSEGKPEDQLLLMLLAKQLGVDPQQLRAATAAATAATGGGGGKRGKQPPNGVPKQ